MLIRRVRARKGRPGFTLIELLTVVAIISLLIAIVLPSLSRAREQAKNTRTRGAMKAIGDALEMFRNENPSEVQGDSYPRSHAADDPTESGPQNTIVGAQWLVRYLLGKDLSGYVTRKSVPPDLLPGGSKYGGAGWEQKGWYDDPNIPRVGPYLSSQSLMIKQPLELSGGSEVATALPPGMTKESLEQPVILDAFDMPILYYAANVAVGLKAFSPLADPGGASGTPWEKPGATTKLGVYRHTDNYLFTGRCSGTPASGACDAEAWDFGAGYEHGIKYYGVYDPSDPNTAAKPENYNTFTYFVLDRNAYEATLSKSATTKKPTVTAVRKDSFILIGAGKDQLYGTSDDVTNF
jgi:prepilin-type N-terminal cleavage/methylation domain-containing protein